MTDQTNTSMVFYESFRKSIDVLDLPAEKKLGYYEAIIDYGLYGKIPHLDTPVLDALFTIAKPNIDANTLKRERAKKAAENGRKGGRPRKKATPSVSDSSDKEKTQNKTGQKTIDVDKDVDDDVDVDGDVDVCIDSDTEKETKDISFISSSSSSKEKEKENKKIYNNYEQATDTYDEQDSHTSTTGNETKEHPKPTSSSTTAPLPTKGKSLSERNNRLYESLLPYVDVYGLDAVQAFYDYWAEVDPTHTYMRFEMEKSWELRHRLERWMRKRTLLNL